MDILFEFILELFLEGGVEISSNPKVSKWIRYPILFFIISFFLFVIGILLLVGVFMFQENIFASIFTIGISIFILVGSILKFRKIYNQKR